MTAQAWVQLGLTIISLIVTLVVFYFKNQHATHQEIIASEHRIRGDMKEIKEDVSALETRVAVIEDRSERQEVRTRLPSSPGRY